MLTAIVLIHADVRSVTEAAQALADVEHVSEVYSVAGDWDLVAIVRVQEHEQLADVVTREIANVPGIRLTQTLIAFRAYSRHDLESLFAIGFREAD